jgi:hypothetical protein
MKEHPGLQNQNTDTDPKRQEAKWTSFTHSGKGKRKMAKLFNDMQIKTAFCTRNRT